MRHIINYQMMMIHHWSCL